MGKNNNTTYGLTVTLADPDANAITVAQEAGNSAADKLSMTAGGLLRDLAKGGVMIAPEWAARIQAAIGTLATPAIVEHVEQSVGRLGEATRVEWIVDPTQISFYQMQADNSSKTLQQQLKAHMDLAFIQGVFGQTSPDVVTLLVTPQQYQQLQQMFGKDSVTGQDVMDRLGAAAPEFAEDDDLITASLGGR